MKIGIFGRRADPQVAALQRAIAAQGARPVVVDFGAFPRYNLATLAPGSGTLDDLGLQHPVSFEELDLVHLRSACFEDLDPGRAGFAIDAGFVCEHHRRQAARLSFQIGLARHLERRIPVLNPPASFLFHRQKAHQQHLLARHGLPVPRTVVTNDPHRARSFSDELGGRVVVKPLAGGAEVVMADGKWLEDHAGRLLERPFIFQQYVKGSSMRGYCLGGRIVSLGRLHHDPAFVDWRERPMRIELCKPGPRLAEQVGRATRLLGMPCCGIDIEEDAASGLFYLLDFNPSALFVGWDQMTGDDMAQKTARYLVRVARGGDRWAGPDL